MKHFLTTLLFTYICVVGIAQTDLSGVYTDDIKIFDSSKIYTSSAIKTVTQVSPNVYETVIDTNHFKGYGFRFSVDANNNIVNWTPVGNTPNLPSSGLMTADNPGNSCPIYPYITYGYTSNVYSNKYNPATGTFYIHYGFGVRSTGQNNYTVQIYDRFVCNYLPKIKSISSLTATGGSKITINGSHFTGVEYNFCFSKGISIGNDTPDSASVVSDSVIEIWCKYGSSGTIKITNNYGSDSISGLVYIPVAPVTKPLWNNVGNLNTLTANAHSPSIVVNNKNIPFIVFADSLNVIRLLKFINGSWQFVGNNISDGKGSNPKIVFDSNDIPYVAFVDSLYSNVVNLKVFDGTNWSYAGWLAANAYKGKYSLTVDSNTIYIAYPEINPTYGQANSLSNNKYLLNVLKCENNNYDFVGPDHFIGVDTFFIDIAIDHKNHIPYIVFTGADNLYYYNYLYFCPHVMSFNGYYWDYVGQYLDPNLNGGCTFLNVPLPQASYPTISIDTAGNPIVSFINQYYQKRQITYKYYGGNWNLMGNMFFSNSCSYGGSIISGKKNIPYVLFQDYSYNKQGSVMQLDTVLNKWNYAGARGFAAFDSASFSRQSIALDTADNPIIAFVNKDLGNSISVMSLGNKLQVNGNVISPLNKPIQETQINISEDFSTTTKTVANSNYNFSLIQNGNYTITPSKNNDINKTNGVTTLDLALTQSHILGKNKLNNPYKIIAADVNGDGKITTLDLVYMKRLILGIDTTFTNSTTKENRLWAFVDSSYQFPDTTNPFPFKDSISYIGLSANKTNQTFIGVKLGDVNYDWNPALARIPGKVFVRPKKLEVSE